MDRNAAEQVAPTQDRNAVQSALRQAQLGPGTAIGEAVFLCLQAAQGASTPGAASAARVVLLSDGANNAGRTPEQAAAARATHVPVSTIAYGTPAGTVTIGGQTIAVPADYTALRALAQDSGGHPYTAQNLVQLRHAFADLTPTATTSTRRTEITALVHRTRPRDGPAGSRRPAGLDPRRALATTGAVTARTRLQCHSQGACRMRAAWTQIQDPC